MTSDFAVGLRRKCPRAGFSPEGRGQRLVASLPKGRPRMLLLPVGRWAPTVRHSGGIGPAVGSVCSGARLLRGGTGPGPQHEGVFPLGGATGADSSACMRRRDLLFLTVVYQDVILKDCRIRRPLYPGDRS
jgi:hypothetical protein